MRITDTLIVQRTGSRLVLMDDDTGSESTWPAGNAAEISSLAKSFDQYADGFSSAYVEVFADHGPDIRLTRVEFSRLVFAAGLLCADALVPAEVSS